MDGRMNIEIIQKDLLFILFFAMSLKTIIQVEKKIISTIVKST